MDKEVVVNVGDGHDYGDGIMTSNNYDVTVMRIVMTMMGMEEQNICANSH
jgi:hypothetical protein